MSAGLSNSPHENGPRVLGRASWRGVDLVVKDQNISALTTWSIVENRHTAVVHLDGAINRLETELHGAGGVVEPPMPGEVWVIPARERYSSLAQGRVVRYAELFFHPDEMERLGGSTRRVRARAGSYDPFLHQAVERLADLARQTDDLARLSAEALSHAVSLHFLHAYSGGDPVCPRRAPRFGSREERLIKEYIAAHLGQPIRLERLAALAGVDSHTLLIAFRRSFGTTPAQYVIEQRLRRARWLLQSTARDIMTIAMETGFSSHAHLATAFKSRVGMTPREFRKIASR